MSNNPAKNGDILLESGTNELEVLVFTIGGQQCGVNVAKVREVILPIEITSSPSQPETVKGMFCLRGAVLPLVDLHHYLEVKPTSEDPTHRRIIVTEFNGAQAAFEVENVDSIYRMSWQNIRPIPEATGEEQFAITGIAEIGEQLIMMLDFESIYDHIAMQDNLHVDMVENKHGIERESFQIALAEDSRFIRGIMESVLKGSGYTNLKLFNNGQEAWMHFAEQIKSGSPLPHVLITDIEMPQIDGLHLCRRIKTTQSMAHVPVLLFSSLITNETKHKGEQVGAEGQLAKPDVGRLVETIDEIVNKYYSDQQVSQAA